VDLTTPQIHARAVGIARLKSAPHPVESTPMAMEQPAVTALWCDGCGRLVDVIPPQQVWTVMRQPKTRQPLNPDGRVTMYGMGSEVIHQCADGEYRPSDELAPRRY